VVAPPGALDGQRAVDASTRSADTAQAARGLGAADPVVARPHPHASGARAHPDRHGPRPRMFGDVGPRLGANEVDGGLNRGSERGRVDLDRRVRRRDLAHGLR
jgi:hypothetical protein